MSSIPQVTFKDASSSGYYSPTPTIASLVGCETTPKSLSETLKSIAHGELLSSSLTASFSSSSSSCSSSSSSSSYDSALLRWHYGCEPPLHSVHSLRELDDDLEEKTSQDSSLMESGCYGPALNPSMPSTTRRFFPVASQIQLESWRFVKVSLVTLKSSSALLELCTSSCANFTVFLRQHVGAGELAGPWFHQDTWSLRLVLESALNSLPNNESYEVLLPARSSRELEELKDAIHGRFEEVHMDASVYCEAGASGASYFLYQLFTYMSMLEADTNSEMDTFSANAADSDNLSSSSSSSSSSALSGISLHEHDESDDRMYEQLPQEMERANLSDGEICDILQNENEFSSLPVDNHESVGTIVPPHTPRSLIQFLHPSPSPSPMTLPFTMGSVADSSGNQQILHEAGMMETRKCVMEHADKQKPEKKRKRLLTASVKMEAYSISESAVSSSSSKVSCRRPKKRTKAPHELQTETSSNCRQCRAPFCTRTDFNGESVRTCPQHQIYRSGVMELDMDEFAAFVVRGQTSSNRAEKKTVHLTALNRALKSQKLDHKSVYAKYEMLDEKGHKIGKTNQIVLLIRHKMHGAVCANMGNFGGKAIPKVQLVFRSDKSTPLVQEVKI